MFFGQQCDVQGIYPDRQPLDCRGGRGSVRGSNFGEPEHKTLKIGIIGASGFSRETADICIAVGYEQIIFVDIDVNSESCFGFPIVEEKQVTRLHEEGYHFVIGIGDNAIRKKIYNKFIYLKYINLVHPSVSLGHKQFQSLMEATGNIVAAGVRFTNTITVGNFDALVKSRFCPVFTTATY